MNTKALALAVVAATLLLVGAVGAVGAQPEDAGPGGDAGPPDGLSDPVPDFVSDIHSTITEFLDGSTDSLGEAVSDLTPGGEDGSADSGGEDDSSDGAA